MTNSDQQRAWVLAGVERYEPALLRYALRMGIDVELARDCVQHAFLRLCEQNCERLAERQGAWLFAVVRNRAVDQLRRAKREVPFAPRNETETDEPAHDDGLYDDRLHSAEPDPGDACVRNEAAALLRRLVETLPPPARETTLLWAEGLTYAEIAHVTGRAEAALRVTLHRALARLRAHPQVRVWLRNETPETDGRAEVASTQAVLSPNG